MIEFPADQHENTPGKTVIVGLGGAGNNILKLLSNEQLPGCSVCSINLDMRQLRESTAPHKIHLGETLTHGLGSGGDPQIAAKAANEGESQLSLILEGNELLVLLTGLGGGTGSGAAPVIASIAKEMGLFTVVVATLPFSLEGKRRHEQADEAVELLRDSADILLCFENNRVDRLLKGENKVLAAYEASNNLLAQVTRAIPMLSAKPGLFHLGLDDLKAIIKNNSSHCLFGYGEAEGEERAIRAAEQVLSCPLFISDKEVTDNRQVLLHVTGSESLTIDEVEQAVRHIATQWKGAAHIHFGISILPEAGESIRIMAFAAEKAASGPSIKQSVDTDLPLVAPRSIDEEISPQQEDETEIFEEREQTNLVIDEDDYLPIHSGEPSPPIIIETEEDPINYPETEVDEYRPYQTERETGDELDYLAREEDIVHKSPAKNTRESIYAPRTHSQNDGLFKGLFEEDEPFIVDGEDLDLPPSMRKKS